MQERFADACHSHRLAGDIVATQLANAMVNQLGCTFAQRMYDVTGADALAVADICRETAFPLLQAGQVYVAVVEYLQLNVLARYLLRAHNDSYWQFLAQETFMDDLEAQAKALTQHLLQQSTANSTAQELIEVWAARHELLLQRWHTMMNAFHGSAQSDYAMFALTLRELADLVQVNYTGTGNKDD